MCLFLYTIFAFYVLFLLIVTCYFAQNVSSNVCCLPTRMHVHSHVCTCTHTYAFAGSYVYPRGYGAAVDFHLQSWNRHHSAGNKRIHMYIYVYAYTVVHGKISALQAACAYIYMCVCVCIGVYMYIYIYKYTFVHARYPLCM